jgi:hypothetical protein
MHQVGGFLAAARHIALSTRAGPQHSAKIQSPAPLFTKLYVLGRPFLASRRQWAEAHSRANRGSVPKIKESVHALPREEGSHPGDVEPTSCSRSSRTRIAGTGPRLPAEPPLAGRIGHLVHAVVPAGQGHLLTSSGEYTIMFKRYPKLSREEYPQALTPPWPSN